MGSNAQSLGQMLNRIFLRSRSPFKIPEGRTLLALGRRGSNAQSHFPSPGVKRSIAFSYTEFRVAECELDNKV
jgi:hypothetical protein